jgi:hypothetical protein
MGHGIESTKSIEQERKCKVTYNRMSRRSAHTVSASHAVGISVGSLEDPKH